MAQLPKPQVICTHESDLDGFVSGLLLKRLAKRLFDEDVPLEAFHNHNWRQRALPEKCAWITDLAFESRLDRQNWVVIDHHTTTAQPTKARLIHDLNKSASLLCYELCAEHQIASPELERLVGLTNVGDLFLQDHPDFVQANDYANLVKSYQFWNLYELIEGQLERLLDHPLLEVMAVRRKVENPLGLEWSRRNITELSPTVGFVDTVVGNINIIVHQLLESKTIPYTALVTLFRKGNGAILASFRSRNGDAIKLAEKLQGGGHANAAGASLPRSIQQIPDAVTFIKQAINPPPLKDAALNSLESAFDGLETGKR